MLFLLLSVFLIFGPVEATQSWSPPATVGKNPEFYEAQVAIDANGNAVAVYGCTKPVKDLQQLVWIESSTKLANGNWSTPVQLTSKVKASLSAGLYPRVCCDGQGNAVAIWNFLDGDSQIIQTARLPFGSSEWVVETMSQEGIANVCCATLQIDQNGQMLATWNTSSVDGKCAIESARLSGIDAEWTRLASLEIPYEFVEKHVHLNASGTAWLIFMKESGWFEGKNVNVSMLSPDSSTWSTPETIAEQSGVRYGCPQIVSDLQGNVLTTWQEYQSNTAFVAYQRLQSTSEWKKTDFPKNKTSVAMHGWLSLDPQGNALFVWAPDDKLINTRLAQGQSSWTAPEPISSDEVFNTKYAIDSKGNRLLSWVNNNTLKTSTLPVGETAWTTPFSVASTTDSLEDCQLSDNGSAVILYSNTKTLKAVYGKPF